MEEVLLEGEDLPRNLQGPWTVQDNKVAVFSLTLKVNSIPIRRQDRSETQLVWRAFHKEHPHLMVVIIPFDQVSNWWNGETNWGTPT